MRCVRLRMSPGENAQPALEPKRVRYRADETSAGLQYAAHVFDRNRRIGEMLEEFARHDDVERIVRKGQVVLDVCPHRLDLEPRCCPFERFMVDIDADNGVLTRIVLRQRAGATTDVQDF